MLTGQVTFPETATTTHAPSLYLSVLIDSMKSCNFSLSISTSERTSFVSSSNLRKTVKASRQIKAERLSYREAIDKT